MKWAKITVLQAYHNKYFCLFQCHAANAAFVVQTRTQFGKRTFSVCGPSIRYHSPTHHQKPSFCSGFPQSSCLNICFCNYRHCNALSVFIDVDRALQHSWLWLWLCTCTTVMFYASFWCTLLADRFWRHNELKSWLWKSYETSERTRFAPERAGKWVLSRCQVYSTIRNAPRRNSSAAVAYCSSGPTGI